VLQGWVAPSTVVIGESVVWRAEVGGCDHDSPWQTPLRIVIALHFIAGSTAEAIVEKRSAQSSSVRSIALAVKITVPTRPACSVFTETNSGSK